MTLQEAPQLPSDPPPNPPSKPDPMLGSQVGGYRVTRLLGIGGMARVYEATHLTLDRRVALKILSEQHEEDTELMQRFHREARALARLEHPHIVTLFEVGETERSYFIAMRFIDGQTLSAVLKRLAKARNPEYMPFDQVLHIMGDVAEALDYAHSQGVIHRDVKPSNIMLTADGQAILTDFGLMMHTSEGSSQGTAFGTPRYIAPEQAVSSQRSVPQSDLYSLGIVLYEMLVGETPFNHESPMSMALSHITDAPPPPRSIRPDLSPAVEAVVMRALEKKPEDRYPSGQRLVAALQQALNVPAAANRQSVNQPTRMNRDSDTVFVSSEADLSNLSTTGQTPMLAVDPRVLLPVSTALSAGDGNSQAGAHNERLPVPSTQILTPLLDEIPARHRRWPRTLAAGLLLTVAVIAVVLASAAALVAANTPIIVAADPTETPIPARLRLVYSSDWLAIYNPTDKPAALKGLVLSRGGQSVDTARMVGGTALDGLAPGQCVEIRVQNNDKSEPFMCENSGARAIYIISPNNQVWYDPTGAASTFSVRRNQTLLQNCPTELNTCEFLPPAP